MSVTLRRLFTVPSVLGVALAVSLVYAQQRDQERGAQPERGAQAGQAQREQQRQGVQQQQRERAQAGQANASKADAQLAACLIIGNQKEIALSKLAQQHAQNEEVKSFAQKMIEDHEQFISQLQRYAESGGYHAQELAVDATPTAERQRATAQRQAEPQRPTVRREAERRETDAPDQTEAQRRAARSPELDRAEHGIDFVSLEQEVAQQCVQSIQRELSQKSGADFDKDFMMIQVLAHIGMADKLEVFSRHASPELQNILQQGLATTQQHLEQARQLHKQVEGQAQTGARGEQRQEKSREQQNQ